MPEPFRAKGRGGLEAKCHEHIVEVVRLGRGEVGRLCWLQRAVALQKRRGNRHWDLTSKITEVSW